MEWALEPAQGDDHGPACIQASLQTALAYYRKMGLKPLPLVNLRKTPLIKWKDESAITTATFKANDNIALLCAGGLVVQDFESEADFQLFYPRQASLANHTLVVSTPHGGIHVYWMDSEPAHRSMRIFGDEHPVDFCGVGGYIVAPPSIVDHSRCDKSKCNREGKDTYSVISSSMKIALARNVLASTIRRGKLLGWSLGIPEQTFVRRKPIPTDAIQKIYGKVTEDPPCIKRLSQGVNQGNRDRAAFLLTNYYASWRGMDKDSIAKLLLEWNERNRPPLPTSQILAKISNLGKYTLGCKVFTPWCSRVLCEKSLDSLLRKIYLESRQ